MDEEAGAKLDAFVEVCDKSNTTREEDWVASTRFFGLVDGMVATEDEVREAPAFKGSGV